MNTSTSLVQTLAVQSQLILPGTAGRLLKQIRDLETIAPRFVEAGLVQTVERPASLDIRISGISTRFTTAKLAGGFLFVSAALRMDLRFERNALATEGTDSTSIIDDIDFVDQSKRLQLIEVRQAYEMADRAMKMDAPRRILLIEGLLVLNRSMVQVDCLRRRRLAGLRRPVHRAATAAGLRGHAQPGAPMADTRMRCSQPNSTFRPSTISPASRATSDLRCDTNFCPSSITGRSRSSTNRSRSSGSRQPPLRTRPVAG